MTELLVRFGSKKLISDKNVLVGCTDFQLWSAKLDAEAVSESSLLLDSCNMLSLQVALLVEILLVLPAD